MLVAKCLEVFELHEDSDLDDNDFQTALRTLCKHPNVLLPRELPLLHFAVHNTQQAVVRFILRQEGSYLYQLDRNGNTALNILLSRVFDEVSFSDDFQEKHLTATAEALLGHEKDIIAAEVRLYKPQIVHILEKVGENNLIDDQKLSN